MTQSPRTTPRDPLCEQALRTNRELREWVADLERRLKSRADGSRAVTLKARLTACEVELRERDESPWVFLPWRGYVS